MYREDLLLRGAKKQYPSRVVVHAMGEYIWWQGHRLHKEGGYIHAVDFLRDIEYQVRNGKTKQMEWRQGLSAHILVCPNGDIIRCREDEQGAYHASGFNNDSVGIEFLVAGEHNYGSFEKAIAKPYLTEEQYQSGLQFVRDEWFLKRGIMVMDRHSDLSPGRKVDPGEGFPWEQFLREVGTVR